MPLVIGVLAGILLLGVGGVGALLISKYGSDDDAGKSAGASASAHPAQQGKDKTGKKAGKKAGTHAGSRTPRSVAVRMHTLLEREVRGHQRYNKAVGALDVAPGACGKAGSPAASIRQIKSFAGLRARLIDRLAALPDSGNARLDDLRARLVGIWRELAPKDREYLAWARNPCPRGTKPTTSTASKDRRTAWRNTWRGLLGQHPEWGIGLVPGLEQDPPLLL